MPAEEVVQTAKSFDLSLVISVAALVLSVLSPVISALINGAFHLKEKDLELKATAQKRNHEFYEQHRAEVIERYINAVGRADQVAGGGNRQEFGGAMGEIYMYVDESLWPLLDSISGKVTRERVIDPTPELKELCKKLAFTNVRPKSEHN